jgi:hypothetical protein
MAGAGVAFYVIPMPPKKPENCWICGKPVATDSSGIDELGFPVHAKCYRAQSAKKRSPRPPPKDIVKLDRRLEDRIRNLCVLATTAPEENAWMVLPELWLLTRQHLERLLMISAGNLSGAREFNERRINLPKAA